MSAYPPPPPAGGPYPPYDRNAARAQYRAQQASYRAQQKMQRAAWKAQRRASRRTSIVGPLILLTIGIFFLLVEMHKVSTFYALEWFGHWWPVVLIIAGVILVAEWAMDRDRSGSRTIGGGVISLLILLIVAGLASQAALRGLEWKQQKFGEGFGKLDQMLGSRSDAYDDVAQPIPAGERLVIRNPHGDVIVSGSSSDGQVHVSLHTQTYGWKESETQEKTRDLQPVFSTNGGVLTLNVNQVEGGKADLTIKIPGNAALTVQADHGNVTVNDMQAAVVVSANHGDVNVSGIDGGVTLHVNDDDSSITMRSLRGPVSVEGHSGDIEISEVAGDLTLQGDFFGSTHLQHVNGAVHFETSRTRFSAARLDEEFSVDNDSLDASELMGPVALTTTDKNVSLDRVQGSVDITNHRGSVELTHTPPMDAISIQNEKGSVDLGLPNGARFELHAQTRNGDMENDFGLSSEESGDVKSLRGTVAGGGPTVTISTTDGDVTVRRSSVAPLAPAPPAPPADISAKPPKAPKAPAAPPAPTAPKSYSF
jgi:Putative adhesin